MTNIAQCLIVCLTVAVAAVGCANPPTTLGKVPARNNIVQKYGRTEAYAAVDKVSFMAAEVQYLVYGGHHKINIGDFPFRGSSSDHPRQGDQRSPPYGV
jgi:hypothetical protein